MRDLDISRARARNYFILTNKMIRSFQLLPLLIAFDFIMRIRSNSKLLDLSIPTMYSHYASRITNVRDKPKIFVRLIRP